MVILDYPRVKKKSYPEEICIQTTTGLKYGCLFAVEYVAEIQPLAIKKILKKEDSVSKKHPHSVDRISKPTTPGSPR